MEKRPKAVLVDGKRGGQSMPAAEETEELAKSGAEFEVAGCSCEADLVEQAVTQATKMLRDTASIERAPK